MSTLGTISPPAPEIPPVPVRRFSVEEYHRMIEFGLFPGTPKFELLEGWITPKMTRRPPHDSTLDQDTDVIRGILPVGWRVRAQLAITTEDSEPEPDLAIVRGKAGDYQTRHPGPSDVAFLVEVSESSLHEDRTLKARIYARAGIAVYWIVNLVDSRIEVYSDPTGSDPSPSYRKRDEYRGEDRIPVVIDGREAVQVVAKNMLL